LETKQFSDGVGYGWIDKLKVVAVEVTDEQLARNSVPVADAYF
jgi:asparagine synthase (glutamine-hydrolysing)